MKLDKISKNYKIYAESFQQNTKIKNDYELLNEKYEQNINNFYYKVWVAKKETKKTKKHKIKM